MTFPFLDQVIAWYCLLAAMVNLSSQSPYVHPCNMVGRRTSSRDFTAQVGKTISRCHRLSIAELVARLNCSGTYKERFSAVTFTKARTNAQSSLQASKAEIISGSTAKALRKANSRLNRHPQLRQSIRSVHLPGQTLTINCVLRCTNNQRACGECATVFRQPATPRRFPEFVNEVVCNPNELRGVGIGGQSVGTCEQKTVTQDFLQWTGDWEFDPATSRWMEKYVPYTHVIRSACVFQFHSHLPCTGV